MSPTFPAVWLLFTSVLPSKAYHAYTGALETPRKQIISDINVRPLPVPSLIFGCFKTEAIHPFFSEIIHQPRHAISPLGKKVESSGSSPSGRSKHSQTSLNSPNEGTRPRNKDER
eukprot:TRINITY_DN13548_c1_g1_i1.p1 TRINITY_DN13548_c1_g1~~TRINITY_DN13548_c1_g1_i1.p1  ORF type:complete len:133 (+),score=14.38 TRINITY_DN13548_c1_g1_i1:57-401(+)